MNIIHVNNRRGRYVFPRVGEWVTQREGWCGPTLAPWILLSGYLSQYGDRGYHCVCGLAQDFGISNASAMEILHSCAKPSMWCTLWTVKSCQVCVMESTQNNLNLQTFWFIFQNTGHVTIQNHNNVLTHLICLVLTLIPENRMAVLLRIHIRNRSSCISHNWQIQNFNVGFWNKI